MALPKKSFHPWFVIITFACTPGCSNGSAPVPDAQPVSTGSATKPTPVETAETKLTVYANLDDPDMQVFSNPDAAMIEKQVRAVNWQNSRQRPFVHLSRIDASGGSYLKLQGTKGIPNTDGIFRAVGYGIAGPNWAGESPPLESVDAGLELLLLFRNDPQKLKTIVSSWTVENQQQ